jgi:hypothetical protein
MPNFAIINGSVVANIVVADDLETANELAVKSKIGQFAVQIPREPNAPGLDWVWNGTELINPTPEELI